jgi:hypothetical protein
MGVSGLAVFGNSFLPKQPVHSKPARALAGRLELQAVAAPGKALQRLVKKHLSLSDF